MVHSIPVRDLPSVTPLFADFWQGSERFSSLAPHHFTRRGVFAEQARLLAGATYDRQTLVTVLREQNERLGAGSRTRDNIARLLSPGSVVVIGGQQAGLFGGPLYTVHKVLTILRVAEHAEKELGSPVVPVFWVASEDSDLAEIDHTFVTDRDDKLCELRLAGRTDGKVPVSRVRLGEEVGPLIGELAEALPIGTLSEELLAHLRAAYTPGRTYPQAFAAWMTLLFRDSGLVIVDPSDVRLKKMAHGLFEREIAEKSPITAAVITQTARLVAAGYSPQIELREGFLNLFHQDPARDAITIQNGGYQLKSSGRKFSTSELSGLLAENPDLFTPNAILRPLFQDTLFPSLAVVLGPSEIAYWSQLTLAYETMGIPMPILFPRSSLTLIEQRIERLRTKLDVGLRDVVVRGESIIDDVLKREIPPSLLGRIEDGRTGAREKWAAILAEIDKLDPTLHRTAELGSGRSMRQFDFMEKKIAQAARKKNLILRGQVGRLVAALAPRGGLQERTLNALPFLARKGMGLLARIEEAMDPFAAEHRALVLDP
jgi:bacillithiol biosynthesis cysteine-adding enzyme BshC